MAIKLLNGFDFREDINDGFLTRREAKNNSVDSELRGKVNSKECHQGDCVRMTETEVKDYVENRGDGGLLNLMILQGEMKPSFFSPRAQRFLHHKSIEYLERLIPELNFLARDGESLTILYREKILKHISDSRALHFEMPTGFSADQSDVKEIHLFHDMLLDGPGVYLAVDGEFNRKMFLPTVNQIFAVHEMLLQLHEIGYSMEPVLRVFQVDEHYVSLEAFRWRREGEDPSGYVIDAGGVEVPSDVQEVVLKINTITREIVDENPGQLPP